MRQVTFWVNIWQRRTSSGWRCLEGNFYQQKHFSEKTKKSFFAWVVFCPCFWPILQANWIRYYSKSMVNTLWKTFGVIGTDSDLAFNRASNCFPFWACVCVCVCVFTVSKQFWQSFKNLKIIAAHNIFNPLRVVYFQSFLVPFYYVRVKGSKGDSKRTSLFSGSTPVGGSAIFWKKRDF